MLCAGRCLGWGAGLDFGPQHEPSESLERGGLTLSAYVWGVDPSTVRVSIATAVSGAWVSVQTKQFTKCAPRTGERLKTIGWETADLAGDLAVQCPPCAVFVEQPFAAGRGVEPELYYAVGVIQAVLAEFAPVQTIPVPTWKKQAVGYGAAKKPDVLRWAQRKGYEGESQDEADAIGIAVAGVKLMEPAHEQLGLTA